MAGQSNSRHNPALGDVGTKLLFENDSVKVWEMVLEPIQRRP